MGPARLLGELFADVALLKRLSPGSGRATVTGIGTTADLGGDTIDKPSRATGPVGEVDGGALEDATGAGAEAAAAEPIVTAGELLG